MEIIQKKLLALLFAITVLISSCGPTGNGNSMDEKNSGGEGSIDSTRLTNFDSTSQMPGDSTIVK